MNAAQTLNQKMAEVDELIRGGELAVATRLLKKLNPARVPAAQLARYGALCRRTGLYYRGLLALTPPVRRGSLEALSAAHRAEYALLLQRRGVIDEALRILGGINAREFPETLLYQAFCLFNQWRYAEAVPLLENYVKCAESPYLKLVGDVNLCAALVTSGADARALLDETLARAHEGGHRRLEANCFELRAQLEITSEDFKGAEATLDLAAGLIEEDQAHDTLFIRKWRAVARALRTNDHTPLLECRRASAKAVEYETLRSIDLYLLKIRHDDELFHRLYFGTPFPEYRLRIEKFLGRTPTVERYSIGGSQSRKVLDLTDERGLRKIGFKRGTKTLTILTALLRDLYQPARLGRLFSEVFPEDHFAPAHSPARVRMLLSRTQKILQDSTLPLRVDCGVRGYTLALEEGVQVIVPKNWDVRPFGAELVPQGIELTFKELTFVLRMSQTETRSYVRRGLADGSLRREGAGKLTRYLRAR